ncbi:hypothetical protein [Kumtagia ephedrae]|uniref:Uncharacterized protein n=1 Tax=Kumtagia ephedrae TaxID=2116701 RepID=A0A2P7SEV7_9HYPH|nr:hypothetical protein [Mesorhizobium ephedrae]PSJ61018.1 hypothetical protein C7I84_09925 [Mesorhizobium ephedrae]
MFTRRQTIRLCFVTVVAFLVWTVGGWLILKDQPEAAPATQLFTMAGMAMLLFAILLTFSIFFSSLFHLSFVATRADDMVRNYGHLMYYVLWKELQDHIDACAKANPK